MNNYSAYPAYKSSGFDWFGEIPEHWELHRLKFVASINPSKAEVSKLSGDTEVSFLPMERVGNGSLDLSVIKNLAEIKQGFTYFRDGDVIVAKITPSFENGKGALASGLQSGIGFGTTELHVIRASKAIDRQYLYYLTLTHHFRGMGETQMFGTAGQKRVPDRFINDFPTPLPPIAEQHAIVTFLDREITHIESMIANKRELINLLDKKRTSIISHAVTKGLNPKARMKPSGVEWLGDVPEHWEVRRLKFLLKERLKYGANEAAEIDNPGFPRFIRITDIKPDGTLRPETFKSLPPEIAEPYLLEDGDILFARSGATVGKTFQYDSSWGKACFAGYLILCRPDLRLVKSRYLYLFTQSHAYLSWRDSIFIQATIQNISAEKYYNFILTVPPLEEQKQIVRYLHQELSDIDKLTRQIEESVDLLQKQRTALISAAVTGKIDVREQGN
jgi:restriction endonuclease S subunit